jgi:hypothetical protein
MHLRRRDDAPRNERGGQVSRLLLAPQLGSTRLGVTWVRGEPGSQQVWGAKISVLPANR